MKLNAAALAKHLQRAPLYPLYWVSGDEPLLLIEAVDSIRHYLQQQGFGDIQRMSVDAGFDWSQLYAAGHALSLFADKTLIDLRLHTKLSDKGPQALVDWVSQSNLDAVVLLSGPKLDAAETRAKWFKTIEAAGLWLPIWPLEGAGVLSWLRQRAQHHGLQFSDDALKLLNERVEGNLLAANQELMKLQLSDYPQQRIDVEQLLQAVSDSSRYDLFGWVEYCLAGDLAKSLHSLEGLQAESVEPVLMIWALTRELRLLLQLHQGLAQGQSWSAVCRAARVWERRQPLFKQALRRLPPAQLSELLGQGAQLDGIAKGQRSGDIGLSLHQWTAAVASSSLQWMIAG